MRAARFRHIVFAHARTERRRGELAQRLNGRHDHGGARLREVVQLTAQEESFVGYLFTQCGLDAQMYRSETLRRRIPACLRALRAQSLPQASQMLEHKRALCQVALSAMVIGVTSFFRDAAVFDHLTYT